MFRSAGLRSRGDSQTDIACVNRAAAVEAPCRTAVRRGNGVPHYIVWELRTHKIAAC